MIQFLIRVNGKILEHTLHLKFHASNNQAKYEDVIARLKAPNMSNQLRLGI